MSGRRPLGGSAGGGKRGSSVTFVRQEPSFLRRMKEAVGYREPEQDLEAKRAKAPGGADDDLDDSERPEDRPTVVTLREGDLTQEEADREWDKEDKRKKEEEGERSDGICNHLVRINALPTTVVVLVATLNSNINISGNSNSNNFSNCNTNNSYTTD